MIGKLGHKVNCQKRFQKSWTVFHQPKWRCYFRVSYAEELTEKWWVFQKDLHIILEVFCLSLFFHVDKCSFDRLSDQSVNLTSGFSVLSDFDQRGEVSVPKIEKELVFIEVNQDQSDVFWEVAHHFLEVFSVFFYLDLFFRHHFGIDHQGVVVNFFLFGLFFSRKTSFKKHLFCLIKLFQ